ncbi:hypothetical protein RF11_08918 [Thelohanellus kitauei]|uniref:Uncharacterized protein n=1 Tax=Thelohanellus kitauei TaxID=669202 RepID=A0A0C2JAE7_THEKT|nr:hypothetical protein RF11_08918 [Thelohanellus kitauei]
MVKAIRACLTHRQNISDVFNSNLQIVLDNLVSKVKFTDMDYFVAICYFRRFNSVIAPLNTHAKSFISIKKDACFYMKSLSDDAQYMSHPEIGVIKNQVYVSQRLIDQDINAYFQLIEDGEMQASHDLLEKTLNITLKDERLAQIVISYIKNLIEYNSSLQGKTKLKS